MIRTLWMYRCRTPCPQQWTATVCLQSYCILYGTKTMASSSAVGRQHRACGSSTVRICRHQNSHASLIAFSVGRYPLFVTISLTQGILQMPSARDIISLNPLTDTWPPAQQERKIKKRRTFSPHPEAPWLVPTIMGWDESDKFLPSQSLASVWRYDFNESLALE